MIEWFATWWTLQMFYQIGFWLFNPVAFAAAAYLAWRPSAKRRPFVYVAVAVSIVVFTSLFTPSYVWTSSSGNIVFWSSAQIVAALLAFTIQIFVMRGLHLFEGRASVA